MTPYSCKSRGELEKEYQAVLSQYDACKAMGLKLNMARGKPSKQQLDSVSGLLTVLQTPEDCFEDGIDCRNYGELAGLPSARAYWADILGCKPEETFVGGSSSLNFMFDVVSRAYTHGLLNSPRAWCREERVKFLCPSPGYDRHFRLAGFMGAELIAVPMTPTGPDMDMVEELVKDPQVKGIWCVPKYSNPDGIIYSDETIHRLAALNAAAPDFILMWDNAYCVHEFEGEYVPFPDIISLCAEAGHPDMVFEFASTSKITFAGAGISVLASSKANIDYFTGILAVQMISYDKLNQLRHVRFLKDKEHTIALMKEHGKIMAPKFHAVFDALEREIRPLGFAHWNQPKGGYFVSLNTMPGTARRALYLCKQAGVTMTPAGATYPNGLDPLDSNIRIAPSFPPVEELVQAMDVFCTCLKLAALEQLLGK
ncbi:MAG TPA: aminotransferase class I/II-fold pyridoxal phosphate-dependent enzyme [Candidatus Faecousia intestinigallinarum]|nr:aminotransferase class I/II-fold pyridoxal phosphate-dependent enzyme [Candidatus Faecousia intestinigallinarum]